MRPIHHRGDGEAVGEWAGAGRLSRVLQRFFGGVCVEEVEESEWAKGASQEGAPL